MSVPSRIGHQFATPVDWVEGRQRLFKDALKTARDWEPPTKGGHSVSLQESGWPASDAKTVVFTEGGPGSNGLYHCRFKPVAPATARLISTGGSPIDISPPSVKGEYVYQDVTVRAKAGQTPQMHLIVSGTGGGFTDLQILRPGFDNFDDADPLNAEPISLLVDILQTGCLRSMGWLKTNGSLAIEYRDFTEPGDIFWRADENRPSDRGCPYEVFLEECKRCNCDAWINHPHMGSDDCARQMAKKALSSLPGKRAVVVEFSNETWNTDGRFTQSAYCIAEGTKLQLAGDTRFHKTDKYVRGNQWATMRSCQVFRIWQREWGAESYRLRHVIAGQASNSAVLDAKRNWVKVNENTETFASVWGYAVTGYFGADNVYTNRADFVAEDLFKTGYTISGASFPGIYLDDRSKLWGWPKQQTFIAQCREDRKTANIYEGGESLGESDIPGVSDEVTKAVRAEKAKAQEDPRLKQYVKQGVGGFFQAAGDMAGYFMYFLFCNKWGKDVYGLTDDVARGDVPKVQAISELASGLPLPPVDPTEGLKNRIVALEKENAELRASIGALQADNEQLKQSVITLTVKNNSLVRGVNETIGNLQALVAMNS